MHEFKSSYAFASPFPNQILQILEIPEIAIQNLKKKGAMPLKKTNYTLI